MKDNSKVEFKLQDLVDDWWVKSEDVVRGSLIEAFIPHVDQVPYQFEPIGRKDPRAHNQADVIVKPLKVGESLAEVTLPVAGMPRALPNEYWSAFRSKKRPCIVLSGEGDNIDKAITKGMANHSTAPTIIVAPYYGIANSQKRAGYNPLFVERVRHVEYKQFLYDELPHSYGQPSILRFDHIMPIGAHYKSYKHLGYKLGAEAEKIFTEYLQWNFFGGVHEDSIILAFKDLISD
ncbi:hypothetical protein [Pseudoalteromonas sp. 1181_04]|uniref:hypothetical protein n=1 Tax=Pseudoalteromonas sp. 1181_04 TaxID=2604450 RepID=UPI0040639B48